MPLPPLRGVSTRPNNPQSLPPPPPPPPPPQSSTSIPFTKKNTILQQQTEAHSLSHQRIPDPAVPHKPYLSVSASTFPLPDCESCNDKNDREDDEDVYVYGSDDDTVEGQEEMAADTENSKSERLRRVHAYALRYLAGDRVYIHCARLRGPVVNNPWKKRRAENPLLNKRQRDADDLEAKPLGISKRRRLLQQQDDREVMETPTQKAAATQCAGGVAPKEPVARKGRGTRKKALNEEEEEFVVLKATKKARVTRAYGPRARKTTSEARASTVKLKARATAPMNNRAAGEARSREPSAASKLQKPKSVGKGGDGEEEGGEEEDEEGGGEEEDEEDEEEIQAADIENEDDARNNGTRRSTRRRMDTLKNVSRKANTLSKKGWDKVPQKAQKRPTRSGETVTGSPTGHPVPGDSVITPVNSVAGLVASSITKPIPLNDPETAPLVRMVEDPPSLTLDAPQTHTTYISMSKPTPPSKFYGPGSSKNDTGADANQANLTEKLYAVRREGSEPVRKAANARGQAAAGVKPKRAGSAPAAAIKRGAARDPKGVTIPEEKGAKREMHEVAGGAASEWIHTPNDFRYKKTAGRRVVAVVADPFAGDIEDNGNTNEGRRNKGKGKAIESATQKKRKKPRPIDFAALSPFGGGQVVTKSGKVYSNLSKEKGPEEGPGGEIGGTNSNNYTRALKENASKTRMVPTPSASATGNGQANRDGSPLREIPGNSTSQDIVSNVTDSTNRKIMHPKDAAGLSTQKGADKAIEVSDTAIGSGNNHPVSIREPESTREEISTTISEAQSLNMPLRLSQSQQFVVPGPPAPLPPQRRESQNSPWMGTQRQLSVAKRGFMSILDIPISEKSSPVQGPASMFSRALNVSDHGSSTPGQASSGDQRNILPHILLETPAVRDMSSIFPSMPNSLANLTTGNVPDTSPSTMRYRMQRVAGPSTPAPSALRRRNGGDLTLPPAMALSHGVREDKRANSHSDSDGAPPDFSPLKAFDTPTKSQFGGFMQGFSPLRYSGDGLAESEPESASQPQSQEGMVDINLTEYSRSESNDPKPSGGEESQSQPRTSAWIGVSRTSGLALFSTSPLAAAVGPSSQTPRRPLTPPSAIFSPTQYGGRGRQPPTTPSFPRSGSCQFVPQSPGTKLAGDMLELMGGGLWDIDDELRKMGNKDSAGGDSNLITPAPNSRKAGVKGLFSSGLRKSGSGTRRR